MAIMSLFSVSYAMAQQPQWTTYYVTEQVGQDYSDQYLFKFDWTNKYYFFDSDSEDASKGLLKNYKENGNKKSFDVYYDGSVSSNKYCSAEFVTNENNTWSVTISMVGQDGKTYTSTYNLSDKEPKKSGEGGIERKNPKDLLKGGVDKVTNVFKKKDK